MALRPSVLLSLLTGPLLAALLLTGCGEQVSMATGGAKTTAAPPPAMAARPVSPPMAAPAPIAPPPHAATGAAGVHPPPPPPPVTYPGQEIYQAVAPNGFRDTAAEPVSTFAASVNTASYANLRRFLTEAHRLPPPDAVRVEEVVNAFSYAYAKPAGADRPFQPTVWISPSPWRGDAEILQIGLKGWAPPPEQRPRLNLVFLIDVSGSMQPPDRLPLLQQAFHELAETLRPDDRVAIVTYASGTQLVLPPTADKAAIEAALAGLRAGGGTYGAGGLQMAYEQAEKSFDPAAVNRVILGTDGDFNLGISEPEALAAFVRDKRDHGIYLSFLGVGRGNFNDALAQKLVNAGKGNASYIDTIDEARRVLIDRQSATLGALADDLKIQVEFNPDRVARYRLIGFETHALKAEEFKDDQVAAGAIGPGHEVTALYEILSPEAAANRLETPRYRPKPAHPRQAGAENGELAFLRLRYKPPGEAASRLIERPITAADRVGGLDKAPADARFAIAAAGFGQLLRHDPAVGTWRYEDALALALPATGPDSDGLRHQFLELLLAAAKARDLRN